MHRNNNNSQYCRIISIVPCSVGHTAVLRCMPFRFSTNLFVCSGCHRCYCARQLFSWMTKPFFFSFLFFNLAQQSNAICLADHFCVVTMLPDNYYTTGMSVYSHFY